MNCIIINIILFIVHHCIHSTNNFWVLHANDYIIKSVFALKILPSSGLDFLWNPKQQGPGLKNEEEGILMYKRFIKNGWVHTRLFIRLRGFNIHGKESCWGIQLRIFERFFWFHWGKWIWRGQDWVGCTTIQ